MSTGHRPTETSSTSCSMLPMPTSAIISCSRSSGSSCPPAGTAKGSGGGWLRGLMDASSRQCSWRVKDLIDIALIAASLSVDGKQLRVALDSVFEARARQSLPARLPVPPRDWERPWRDQSVDSIAGENPGAGHTIAARLIDPAMADRSFSGSWAPDQMRWAMK